MAFGGFDAQSNGVEFHPTEEEIKYKPNYLDS